jgi:hypothetical protein
MNGRFTSGRRIERGMPVVFFEQHGDAGHPAIDKIAGSKKSMQAHSCGKYSKNDQ